MHAGPTYMAELVIDKKYIPTDTVVEIFPKKHVHLYHNRNFVSNSQIIVQQLANYN